jgi:hypothetical protein
MKNLSLSLNNGGEEKRREREVYRESHGFVLKGPYFTVVETDRQTHIPPTGYSI